MIYFSRDNKRKPLNTNFYFTLCEWTYVLNLSVKKIIIYIFFIEAANYKEKLIQLKIQPNTG